MRAIHVNWTRPSLPYLGRSTGPDGYQVEDFELLKTIISTAAWLRVIGTIALYSAHIGEACYRRLGMTGLWDGGIDAAVLESLDPTIGQHVFCTAGLVAALLAEAVPFCSLDTYLVVCRPL